MKHLLKFEQIGDSGTWVAEITGPHPAYHFERNFLKPLRDYTDSNSRGTRGVQLSFFLEEGKIYHVQERQTWKRLERYYCRVTPSGIAKISKEEVDEWIGQHPQPREPLLDEVEGLLPVIHGSPRQIMWATNIRRRALKIAISHWLQGARFVSVVQRGRRFIHKFAGFPCDSMIREIFWNEATRQPGGQLLRRIFFNDQSRFWIDARFDSLEKLTNYVISHENSTQHQCA